MTLVHAHYTYDPKTQTVTDTQNQKMWQDNEPSSETLLSFKSAIAYCEALGLSEYTDWKIPVKHELKSIIDPYRTPSILSVFTHTATGCYWTIDNNTKQSAMIDFSNATYKINTNIEQRCFVRCVREKK